MAVETAPQGARQAARQEARQEARQGARVAGRNGAGLARRLAEALQGEARFDAFTRGRYATNASIYQIMPAGVAFPKELAGGRAGGDRQSEGIGALRAGIGETDEHDRINLPDFQTPL